MEEGNLMALIIYKFMENKEWYYFDEKTMEFKLTDKASKEAIESYKEYKKTSTK
jgi:hypothetical protein